MSQSKIVIILPLEIDVPLHRGDKVRIVKTKKESLFQPFTSPDSVANKICMDVSEDPLLLKFLFLKSVVNTSFYDTARTTITFPFLLDPSFNFKKNLEDRDDYKRRQEKLINVLERNTNEVNEVWANMIKEFLSLMIEQPKIKQLVRSRSPKSLDDITKEITNVVKNNADMKEHAKSNFKTLARYASEIQILTNLKDFSEFSNDAQINCNSIHHDSHFKLPAKKDQICTALGILAKHTDFTIKSMCLDCWFEKCQLPFTSEISRVNSIQLLSQCPTCFGVGLIHKIEIGFPSDLNSLLLGETSWLYEVFIGYMVSSYDFFKKVYVHKKVQPYSDGKVKSGIEIDVIAITTDDKLIVIEVTKQRDESNIRENIETKIKNLEEYEIPYDKLIYITASKAEMYYDISHKNTRIFALDHISNLKGFISDFVSS